MNDLLKELRKIHPQFKEIIVQNIDSDNRIIGYKAISRCQNSLTISGGTSKDHYQAIRIAISEAFERIIVKKIFQDHVLKNEFLLNEYPSTSGFAAGFNKKNTQFRAICEGLERWSWSKWIDQSFKIDQIDEPSLLSELSMHFRKYFKQAYWFEKKFNLYADSLGFLNLHLVIFLGFTDEGVFPGSRVSTIDDNLYEHPVIEASRNYENYLLNKKTNIDSDNIIKERVIFFGENKQIALKQVNQATKTDWPQPKIRLLKDYDTGHPEIFLTRCLMQDFIGWHEGDVTRFVY